MGTDVGGFLSGLGKANKALVTFGATMQVAGFRILSAWTASVGLIGGIAIKAAADFESAFVGIRKTVEGTEAELKRIEEGMKGLAREIPLTVVELSKIAETAGQLGVKTKDITRFTETIAKLGVTTNIVGEEGAAQLARFANITGRANTDFERLGDVIVDLGNNFAATEAEILDFGLGLAGAGRQVGLSQDQILAIGTALASVGARAQAGTTAIQTTFIQMQKSVAQGGKELALFAQIAGKSSSEFSEAFREDAAQALSAFLEGLSKLGEGKAFVALEALGLGSRRTVREILKLSLGVDQLNESLALAAKQTKEGGALSEEAAKRFATFKSQLILLKNEIIEIASEFGNELIPIIKKDVLPAIRDLGKEAVNLINWFKGLEDSTKSLLVKVALLTPVVGVIILGLGSMISLVASLSGLISLLVKGVIGLAGAFGSLAISTKAANVAVASNLSLMTLMTGAGGKAGVVGGAAKGVSRLGLAVRGLGVAAAVVGTFWVAFKLTDFLLEITGARKAINAWIDDLVGLRKTAEGMTITPITKQDIALIERAEEITGRVFTRTREGIAAANEALFAHNMELRKVSSNLKEVKKGGDEVVDTVDNLTTGIRELSEAAKGISESFSELTREGLAQAVSDFIEGTADALKKGQITKAFMEKFLTDFDTLWRKLADEPALKAALEEFATESGILIGGIMPAAMAKEFAEQFATPMDQLIQEISTASDDVFQTAITDTKAFGGIMKIIFKNNEGITAIMSGVQRLQETLIEVWGDSPKGFRGLIDLALDDLNSFLSAIVGIGQAIAGVISTAQAQGPLAGALSGALAGGQIGEALFGPGGALAGAIVGAIGGALIGLFGKPEFKKAMEDVAKNFGVAISEELGKAIADTAKKLDIGRFEASLLKFADILAEAGGLSADNVEQFTARFNDLINAVASGAIPAAEGIEALNEGFTAMVEGLEEMGVKGAVIMGSVR
jgi:TP901 family phage tail tape measure protein